MSGKLRVGVIGAGGIATGAHIPGYQKLLDEVELVATADVNAERAKAVAQEQGFARSYDSYETMLQKETLDAVSVCTPNKFHAPATLAALEAGCHVLCEKPPAMSVDEAQSMVETAQTRGRLLTFGLHMRFSPEVQALKRFIDDGQLGDIYVIRVDAIRRRGIPGWGVFTNKALQGGGPMIDIGVHMLDAALYLMGYPQATQVLASTYQKIGTRPGVGAMGTWDWENFQVEDLALGMVKFANGATMLLETSFAQNIEPMSTMNVRLSGTDGGANLFPLKIYKEMSGTLVDLSPAWLPKVKSAHGEQIKAFVRACREDREPMVKGHEAIRLQQVIDAVYRSAELDDLVRIDQPAA